MLTHLVLQDFRNFTHLEVTVPDSGLVIVGENGQGKTNLLESVAYLSLLRSSRGAKDSECVRFGAGSFHVRADAKSPSAVHRVGLGYEKATRRKRATLDGVEQSRLSNALGALPSVGFAPSDVALVAGGPGERRRYLDLTLALSSTRYLTALQQFRAVLLRRNSELRLAQREHARVGSSHEARVSVWEPLLAEHGGTVTALRAAFVRQHAGRFAELAASIGEPQPVEMRYQPSAGSQSADLDDSNDAAATFGHALLEMLAQQRSQEMRRGITLAGPHRDELQLMLGGRDLRAFGSAGQQRSAAIALRLIELATMREKVGATPLLLLDDPFAELDAKRASRVLALLEQQHVGQVLLAVPRVEDVPEAFTRLERRTMLQGVLE